MIRLIFKWPPFSKPPTARVGNLIVVTRAKTPIIVALKIFTSSTVFFTAITYKGPPVEKTPAKKTTQNTKEHGAFGAQFNIYFPTPT